ncbi:DUF6270 domain-containing protein [Glutamicibacter ardleyensis]|uniref:DUF6270 domain-containing protein n=1 Tax=Glutamicibacter ardleyensis TaxID=225894 RepID=UPI0035EFBD62
MKNQSHTYYAILEEYFSDRIIYVPRNLCVTTRAHQWGIAPFHYAENFYNYVTDFIVSRECDDSNKIIQKHFR